ncbi:VWA domain-containing protein [Lolliginicoccus suaedae]|uniref:VWA domain-containing protein n=1 Tax=Lolliginicoccus suaedae TaxID=2605429 RepID=UPI001F404CAA|nr:VWA domain-containing protein [Lolliginicoccus suaedae]
MIQGRPGEPGDTPGYPFSAIVGQDQLRLALILCAISPAIGGVLVRGEKGTAKSTIVRALARLLPAPLAGTEQHRAPLVELPIGATEDRVVGSIDLERVLRDSEHAFRPGLLARAHDGVLYVDEVNLLHDHLVDVLLDAAAMGRVHVERDGFSHAYPSRFVLVGTMNPEEGELRPQLLDRFGLAVDVAASRDLDIRTAVVMRRLDYERDPQAFADAYAPADAQLADRIREARDAVAAVRLPEREIRRIAAICARLDVDGMRADLVIARAATAHAAWRGGSTVTEDDIRIAAELALPHRRRRDPFDETGMSEDELDEAITEARSAVGDEDEPGTSSSDDQGPDASGANGDDGPTGDGGPNDDGPDDDGPGDDGPEDDGPGGGGEPQPEPPQGPSGKARERTAGAPGPGFTAPRFELPGRGSGAAGRRSRSVSPRGRIVRAGPYTGSGMHAPATIRAAAAEVPRRGGLAIRLEDMRGAAREDREGNLVIFVVDASGSMAARDRLSAVTGAVRSLLRDAYQRRDKVAVITLRGTSADIVLPPTGSTDVAARRLRDLRTGGRTPLAEGLVEARGLIQRERRRDPDRRALVVLLTDGRATAGPEPVARARTAARGMARDGIASITIDCEHGMVSLGLAAELAHHLRGGYVRLNQLSASTVSGVVRAARGPGAAAA